MKDWLWRRREVRKRKRAGKCGFYVVRSDPRYPLDICVRPAPCPVHLIGQATPEASKQRRPSSVEPAP